MRIACIALALSASFAQTPRLSAASAPPIAEIMARVAANQARSVDARKQFVYRQEELVSMRRGNGSVDCKLKREYTVAPGPKGIDRQFVTPASGDTDKHRCTMEFTDSSGASMSVKVDSADENDSLIMSLGRTADGIPRGLFPLTAGEQHQYEYKLAGVEKYRGRTVYRVGFRPNRKRDSSGMEGYWKGEALIDAEEFQPVSVVTDLTAKVPLAVRVLLGTNVHGLGFSVTYERVADGVWFPATFGGEFEVRALFFFKESISVNVKNGDFRHTDVQTKVAFEGER